MPLFSLLSLIHCRQASELQDALLERQTHTLFVCNAHFTTIY